MSFGFVLYTGKFDKLHVYTYLLNFIKILSYRFIYTCINLNLFGTVTMSFNFTVQ